MISKRCSSLSNLAKCPGLYALRTLEGYDGGSSAAQSGSAVGRLIELHHKGVQWEDSLREVQANPAYDLADMDMVAKRAACYIADPRNRGVVLPESLELTVKVTYGSLELVGHVDQIRTTPRGLQVWDVKNGKPGGIQMLHDYAWQLAAYALACTETLGERVLPGGIIRLAGYTARGKPEPQDAVVFYETPYWTLDQCRTMLDSAAHLVSMLGRGEILTIPGRHCSWCPAAGPHHCPDLLGEEFAP